MKWMKKILQWFVLHQQVVHPDFSASKLFPPETQPDGKQKIVLPCDITVYATGVYTFPRLGFPVTAGAMYRFTFHLTYEEEGGESYSEWGLTTPPFESLGYYTHFEHSNDPRTAESLTTVRITGNIHAKEDGIVFPDFSPATDGERITVRKKVSWVEYETAVYPDT
jgi:hypothetical protein